MGKIKRNAPCPCGSGKKYKKCCLKKDQEKPVGDLQSLSSALKGLPSALEGGYAAVRGDKIPGLDEEEQQIVEDWFNNQATLRTLDETRQHLEDFFRDHPQLVYYLALYEDLLFELADKYHQQQRFGEYIDLLIQIRKDFPDTYIRSFGFYDLDIIRYKIINGQEDEVLKYLNLFVADPEQFADELFKLIKFLMAHDCLEPLSFLLENTYETIHDSYNIIGGEEILEYVVEIRCQPYLKKEKLGPSDFEELVEELKKIKIEMADVVYDPKFLAERFHQLLGPPRQNSFDDCKTMGDVYVFYHGTSHNYKGWLGKQKNMGWLQAEYYRDLVYTYLSEACPEDEIPQEPFVFTEYLLEDTLARTAGDILGPHCHKFLCACRAIYWFAEYLQECGYLSEQEAGDVQKLCAALNEKALPMMRELSYSTSAFPDFPGILGK